MVRLQPAIALGSVIVGVLTFNPTMVRLQLVRPCSQMPPITAFNPTMVRLQRRERKAGNKRMHLSIPLWCDCNATPDNLTVLKLYSFNPTMVRLQPYHPLHHLLNMLGFQSHYGAIATTSLTSHITVDNELSIPLWCDCNGCLTTCHPPLASFQSHYGAIATDRLTDGEKVYEPFNPTMVRLQHGVGEKRV